MNESPDMVAEMLKVAGGHLATNDSETIEELFKVVDQIEVNEGAIFGKSGGEWSAKAMKERMQKYYDDETGSISPNVVTRSYGLRQQTVYLKYYKNGKL